MANLIALTFIRHLPTLRHAFRCRHPQSRRLAQGELGSPDMRGICLTTDSAPYAIWVSEIMLQQTQVATVIPFGALDQTPSLHHLARAQPEQVLKLWEGLGYYSRARNLQAAAKQIMAEHGGRFPTDPKSIRALPGIGRYTAGAISSIALGQAEPIVDGNVIRILTRLFGLQDDPKSKPMQEILWALAEQLVKAADDCGALNQSLMELGATVCHPRAPACERCPVARSCVARRKGIIHLLPAKLARPASVQQLIHVYLITHAGPCCCSNARRDSTMPVFGALTKPAS